MSIRRAQVSDATEIRALIFDSVTPHRYEDFDDEGWDAFGKPNGLTAIEERILSDDYLTLCHEEEGTIVGITTILRHEKIDQLFVHPLYRRIGIAKGLWDEARRVCEAGGGLGNYWVKSSTLAVPLYESFGFTHSGGRQKKNGIVYYPMELVK